MEKSKKKLKADFASMVPKYRDFGMTEREISRLRKYAMTAGRVPDGKASAAKALASMTPDEEKRRAEKMSMGESTKGNGHMEDGRNRPSKKKLDSDVREGRYSFSKGGYVACGASVPPSQKGSQFMKKGTK